ncbi:MAG: polyphenol oxidase family protein [Synergistaceae bacterium]|jgi:copper oxidase (laccase) domain-containing protein|nr:polyphenol oxidase family protein [Synergistaceae bacterium]
MPSPDEGRSRPFQGFEINRDDGGYRIDYVMPGPLNGVLSAVLLCRGALLDGTAGDPSRIASRIGRVIEGSILTSPLQVHGSAVIQGRAVWALPQRVRADGVHLDASFDRLGRVAALLRFADCVPILLASASPRPWAVVLHSGFKGTMHDIFSAAWRGLRGFYGSEGHALDSGQTYAWIGPAIGPCCFTRVLTEALALRAEAEWGAENSWRDGGFVHLDLIGVISAKMKSAGIPGKNIMTLPLCTRCHSDKFYSYRAGDFDDRMALVTRLKKC